MLIPYILAGRLLLINWWNYVTTKYVFTMLAHFTLRIICMLCMHVAWYSVWCKHRACPSTSRLQVYRGSHTFQKSFVTELPPFTELPTRCLHHTKFRELPHVTLRRDYVLHISPDIVSTFVGHYRIDWLLGASAL